MFRPPAQIGMNILILCDYISLDYKSGSSDVAYGMAEALSDFAHVEIMCFKKDKNTANFQKKGNLIIHRVTEKMGKLSMIKNIKYDVVLIHSIRMYINYLLSEKSNKRAPIVYFEHSPVDTEYMATRSDKKDLKYLIFKIMEKFIHKKSDAILFATNYMKNMARLTWKEEKKSVVMSLGIHPDSSIKDSPLTEKEKGILSKIESEITRGIRIISSVRGLKKRTGVDNLIKAFSNTKEENVKLYIAGDGPLHNSLKTLISDFNLENKVVLLGRISDEMKYKLYSLSTFSVMPTISLEGFGISMLESMYVGCPAVVTPIGGMYEFYMQNGLEELITNTIEPQSIALKIKEILNGKIDIKTLGEKSKKIAKNYTYEKLGSFYLKSISYELEIISSKKG